MITKGNFIYKGLEKKDGGEFTNEKGQKITYKPSYLIKFDEQKDSTIYDRKTKISVEDVTLYEKLKLIKLYTPVEFIFDVSFYSGGVIARLVDVNVLNNK